jgi:hypothetical protein
VIGSGLFPSVGGWIAGTPTTHPLRELFDAPSAADARTSPRRMILAAFDTIISRLEAAQPLRLAAELKDFRNARTSDDLRIVRSELVAGGMLAAAGVGFDFGTRGGTPQPDLVLRETSLGIEIKNRTLDGLRELERNLDEAVADLGTPVTIYLACDKRPLVIKADVRTAIVQQASGMIQAGQRGTFVTQLDQPWAATPQLNLSVRVADRSPVPGSARVIFEEGFTSLPGPLDDAETEVVKVLQDEQKIQQALAMPTILLVDAALTGMSVFRPMNVWAQRLNVLLPTDTPFVGIAVMMPELISPDAPLALVTRPGIDSATLAAVKKLAADLGVGEVA